MKVCVYGLGHLGSVTAACLASVGHEVSASDWYDQPHRNEPGLAELLSRFPFASGPAEEAVKQVEILWVTFDTPVSDNGQADVDFVLGKIREIMPMVAVEMLIIISSQLPVGTISRLEGEFPHHTFVCIPENLRHGTAVENFLHPDRILVGIRTETDRRKILELLIPILNEHSIDPNDLWIPSLLQFMSIESAEMTKHAINAFLATEICFINEIAAICELVGADPKEVERGMKTEARIGPKAYLTPGGPYTGKTLARDVKYLREWSDNYECPLIWAVEESNQKRGGE